MIDQLAVSGARAASQVQSDRVNGGTGGLRTLEVPCMANRFRALADPQLLPFPTPSRGPEPLSLLLPSVGLWRNRRERGDLVVSQGCLSKTRSRMSGSRKRHDAMQLLPVSSWSPLPSLNLNFHHDDLSVGKFSPKRAVVGKRRGRQPLRTNW